MLIMCDERDAEAAQERARRALLFARLGPAAEFGARLARVKAKVDAAAGELAACN